jgi:quercetin dioxygenase-like cupin family protein
MEVKAIDKYRTNRRVLITYDEIKEIPIQFPIDLDIKNPGAILCTKIHETEFSQSFRVEMKQEAYWSTHYHNCLETILVFKGELYDHTNNKAIDKYNPVIIKKYEDHLIESVTDSIFYVEFINPNFIKDK